MDRKLSKLVLIAPISILYTLLIGGGFIILIKESFGYIPAIGLNQWRLSYYTEVLSMGYFYRSIGISLICAGISASLAMVMGTIIAYKMLKTKDEFLKKITNILLRMGIILPYLYMVFLLMLILSQSGLISRLLFHMKLVQGPNDFPNLIYGSVGVIITFTLKGVPFVTLLVFNVMSKINLDFDQVAMTLGGDGLNIFRRIYLPLSRDTIVWTGIVLFAYDMGSFEVPYIFSSLKSQNFAVKLYGAFLNPNIKMIPTTMAMTVILFVISLVFVMLFALLMRSLIRRLCI